MTETLQSRWERSDPARAVMTHEQPTHPARSFLFTRYIVHPVSYDTPTLGCPVPGLNLFRRNEERDILCAVPEDCPVPTFLQDPAWSFTGRLDWMAVSLPGFDLRAARSACRGLGFYLFQTWDRAKTAPARKACDQN